MIHHKISLSLRFCMIVLAACATGLSASQALAGAGIFGTYIFIDADGTSTTYGLTETGGATTADFAGIDLGSFVPGAMTLTLDGGQANTFKNGGSDVFGAKLSYRVFESGGTGAAFSDIPFGFGANATYVDAGGVTISGGGDQKWEETSAGVDLLDGLTVGTYNLEVFVTAFTSDGDVFHNAGGSNYIGSFTVSAVPEVSAALSLPLLLGSVFGVRSLRRRRAS